MRARSRAYASALPYTTPTSSAPTRPGPAVTATASIALQASPASARARSTTAGSAARWARLASSGTTPPNTWWMSWERMTRLASSGGRVAPPTSTAADVSSHEVSIPRTTSAMAALSHDQHRFGDRPRGDPPGRQQHQVHDRAVGDGTTEVDNHLEAVLGEPGDDRLWPADHDVGAGRA